MKRIIEESLNNWADKTQRKPLIISGARQIGKSWSVRNLGNSYFKGNFI